MQQHLDYLDLLKGFGIILVVMGHTMFPIHAIIDIFHMPLFFFISGLTLKTNESSGVFLVKKTNRIFVPWCFFTVISACVELFVGYDGPIFNGPLWFLQTLFVSLLISYMVCRHLWWWQLIISTIFSIYGYIICHYNLEFLPFSLETAIRSSVFIIAGNAISKVHFHEWHNMRIMVALIAVLSLFVLSFYCSYHYYHISGLYKTGEICGYNYLLFYSSAFSGLLTFVLLSVLIKKIKIINWWGCNSLVILAVHFPFTEWLNTKIAVFHPVGIGKIIIGLIAYATILIFSTIMIWLCRTIVPHYSGYAPLFNNKITI